MRAPVYQVALFGLHDRKLLHPLRSRFMHLGFVEYGNGLDVIGPREEQEALGRSQSPETSGEKSSGRNYC